MLEKLAAEREIVFAIRGDIISRTGYAKAAIALANILAKRFRVVGVSMHVDPSDNDNDFPGTIVDDAELSQFARDYKLIVINHSTPDNFLPLADAVNIGLFYWETWAIPYNLQWPERIASMDGIWAPTRFVSDFTRKCGYTGSISIVPWVHDFDVEIEGANVDVPNVNVMYFDTMPGPERTVPNNMVPLRDIYASSDVRYLAVQSLAPRKGLAILIAEWSRFISNQNIDAVLVLKLSFRHAEGISADRLHHILMLLARYGMRPGQRLRVAILEAQLSEDAIESVIAASDCVVSSTYGEGFGGPIVEALRLHVPVITPRHTGIQDLIPSDYALQIASDEFFVTLADGLDVYPSASSWYLPREGDLRQMLDAFYKMDAAERRVVVETARAHARKFCGMDAVEQALNLAMDKGSFAA